MISHRIGRTVPDGEILEQVRSAPLARERFGAMQEHLVSNGVELSKTPVTLGPWLTVNPDTERFADSEQANALVTRDYRAPFVVPERV